MWFTRFWGGIATIASLDGLESLNLSYTPVDAKGFALLQGMPQLRELYLDSDDIGDESVDVLGGMANLRMVNLYHTTFTENGVKRLKEKLPKCQVVWDRDSARPNRRKT
jgi:hypothetical protein